MKSLPAFLALSLAFVPAWLSAAAPDVNDPAAELASFKMAEGFEAHLFASEADGLIKPIQMRWDARGRLWVIQSVTYPQIKPGEHPNDKVLILEDTMHSGHADKVTVFADGLMVPTGLELDGDGLGAWVGEGTRLWHFRDTKGSGHADVREIVMRGFGTGDAHQNLNSFRWSPGGELLFCQGLHSDSRVETPYGLVTLNEAGLWRYRPATRRLDAFFGGKPDPQNPWGWTFTDWGQPFVVAGNTGGIFFPLPEMVRGHDDTRAGNIWAAARTRKTSGPDIVGTAHLPSEWQGAFLTGGYINNGVWALKIADDGAGYRLTDLPPLITSSHTSFRPVDVKIGPDGAIYLCDWYNPIIGHYQASFRHPDRDKVHGRIWRVTATGRSLVQQPPIADASLPQLLQNLSSPERWTREQSKRVLSSREPKAVIAALDDWSRKLTGNDAETEHRLYEALGVYEALESPSRELLERLLSAHSPDARAYAAGTVARWADRLSDPLTLLRPLIHDENPRVRLGAIVAAGNIAGPDALTLILGAAGQPTDRFLDSALHQTVLALKSQWLPQLQAGHLKLDPPAWALLAKADGTPDTAKVLRNLAADGALPDLQREPLLKTLAEVGSAEDLAFLLANIGQHEAGLQSRVLAALAHAASARRIKPTGDLAALLPIGEGAAPAVRAEAFRLAGLYKVGSALPLLQKAAASSEPDSVRRGAIDGLTALGGGAAAGSLSALAAGNDPLPIRAAAISGLVALDLPAASKAAASVFSGEQGAEAVPLLLPSFLQRKGGADALAGALTSEKPSAAAAQAAILHLQSIGRQDERLLAALNAVGGAGPRALKATPEFVGQLVREVRESGSARRGDEIFHSAQVICTACHSIGGKGGVIGPSLDSIGSGQPLDFIIGAVLEPQREVKEGFEAVEITTKEGQVVQGYKVRESGGELVLRDVVQGTETKFRRDQIAQRREIGSLMPSGLVDHLSRQDLRDLFRYLSELGKPKS